MNKRKLELYEDLFQKMGPGANKVTIEQIASAFKCSERHARTLLKQMSDSGWLTWLPARGRGQKGELNCHSEPIDACYEQVDLAIEEKKYELAHQLISFNGRDIAAGLKQYLGRTSSQNEKTIYAPFHRKIGQLHPHHSMERTERHLIHEVFQTLVTFEGSGLQGDLAHSWDSDNSHTKWTFHLRSSATFHDQSMVTAADVVESLRAMTQSTYWRRLYDHIDQIEALSLYCVVITLTTADPNLPLLLSRAEASILPRHTVYLPATSYLPIGSGPFMVDISSERVLRLVRNNQYSGQCALVEKIEIWIHKEWEQDKKCAENFFFLDGDEDSYKVSTNNIGYFFVQLNHRELQTDSIKHALLRLFQGEEEACFELPFPVSFSYENNNDNREFANKLISLDSVGKKKSTVRQVTYGQAAPNQDLAIGGIRLEGDRATSLFAFFKLYPYWNKSLTWEQHDYLVQTLQSIRSSASATQQEAMLDQLIAFLYDNNVLAIFKSENLTLTVPSRVRNVAINSIGWCDFAKLWVNPV
ncbi:SgrR family transcriptional regulator [Vibrio brasiliensis]|uniref:SgrR family transcriptional regulator n=1 Tax=Vibrio brasiliensis TaxID=170652 RepID=UPI001EFC3A28|nr:SgrR family transcriptional regulator [Vibrio brasiliensis]MCG9725158.1 SgrR family transcriptional regulator [Vibrio brasiliensis]